MKVRADSVLGRLAVTAQPKRPLAHLTLSPWWARVLVAAGAQRADTPDSMIINFPVPSKPEDTNPDQPRDHGAAIERASEQGLLFGSQFAAHPENVGYRGPTACAAAGITYRQLDYWARTGLVEPTVRAAHGSKSLRLYSFRDILVLKVVKRLLDTGMSLGDIRTAINHLRDRGTIDLARLTLISDGVSVYACTSPDEVVDLLAGGQGVFGIALGRIWQEVDWTLAELPGERSASPDPKDSPLSPQQRAELKTVTEAMERALAG